MMGKSATTILLTLAILGSFAAMQVTGTAHGKYSSIVLLDDENWNMVMNGEHNALVLFAAPWCMHSQKVYPEFDKVAATFRLSDGVMIAQVKADEEKSLTSRNGVTGFPTLKWYTKGNPNLPQRYNGGRTADDMVAFLNKKLNLNKQVRPAETHIVTLSPLNFDSIVLDAKQNVMVYFYAEWSKESRDLLRDYEIVGKTYRSDDNVVLCKMDVEKHTEYGLKYGVTSYPTILFFPSGEFSDVPRIYDSGYSPQNYVQYLNKASGALRMTGGNILDYAGTTETLKECAARFMDSVYSNDIKSAEETLKEFDDVEKMLSDTKENKEVDNGDRAVTYDPSVLISGSKKKLAKQMLPYFKHVAKQTLTHGQDWPQKELLRMAELIKSTAVRHAKKTEFMYKRNVLNSFD
jgi:protein disulfide-isomerase A6